MNIEAEFLRAFAVYRQWLEQWRATGLRRDREAAVACLLIAVECHRARRGAHALRQVQFYHQQEKRTP